MMKRILAATTALTFATTATAQSADFAERVAADLAAQGYENIEVETEGANLVAEADQGGVTFEFTYDSATETLISTEEETADDDDDDDHDGDADDDGTDDDSDDDDEDDDEEDEDEDEDDDDDEDEDDEDDA